MTDQFDFDVGLDEPAPPVILQRDDAEFIYRLVVKGLFEGYRKGEIIGSPGPVQRFGAALEEYPGGRSIRLRCGPG